MASTMPFASKKSMGRCAALQWAPPPGQRQGDAPGLSGAGHHHAELEEAHIGALAVPVVGHRREKARQQEGLRTENCADSGFSIGTIACASAKCAARAASMNEKVKASTARRQQHSSHEPIALDSRVGWRRGRREGREG